MLIMFSLELNEKSVVRLHVCDVRNSVDEGKQKTNKKTSISPSVRSKGGIDVIQLNTE